MDTLLNSGDILNSRYRILHQIGHGGFGRTYLAEDLNRFNERCVLKQFAPQLEGSFALEKAQELFEREAEVLYRLQHPQIPKFRELFRYKHQDKGCLLLVQEYIEGQTYHRLVNNRAQQGLKFSEAEITQLLHQLLPVLEYIHSMGVIHRDISPDNLILRCSDGLAVLIDFGSIKEVATKAQFQLIDGANLYRKNLSPVEPIPYLEPLPLIGTVLGKNGYAPPEQIERGTIHPHSDLYALAATIVVLLTGKEPQQLIAPYSYQWNWQQEVNLSSHLEWVLTKMLSPNPLDRFGSATEVLRILEDILVLNSENQPTSPQSLSNKIQILPSPKHSKVRRQSLRELYLASKLLFWITLTVMLVLGGFWWLKEQNSVVVSPLTYNSTETEFQLRERFSQGEKVLIPQMIAPEKELAVAAFAQGKYEEAVSLLSASLKTLANDPEALIYLNNARIGQEKSYSIAVSVPIGSNINASQEILRGVAQAQNQVNQAGGIKGIPLKVYIVNDDNKPEIGQQIAKTLSQNPEILGVVGHYASDVTLATAKIYQSAQLVSISPISTSITLSNLSPYLFRTVPSDYLAARALTKYMFYTLKHQNVAVFYNSQSNSSQSLKSEFITAISLGGGRVVNTFDLSYANFSAADSWKKAIKEGAEVLILVANNATLDKALQVILVNRQRLSLLGGDEIYTPKTLQVAGELGEGMVLAIPWHINSRSEDEFAKVAKKLWGAKVNWRTAMAYDAARALIAALKSNPTRPGVQKALADPHFSVLGACNQVRFLPSGDRLKPMELVKIQPSDRHSFSYEFTPLVNKVK